MANQPSVETLKAIVNAFNAHDLDRIMSFFSEDCVLEMPRGPDPWGSRSVGAAAVREALRSRFTGIPDVHYGDDTHFVSGDIGVSQWTLRGTRADRERVEVRGLRFLHVSRRQDRKEGFVLENPRAVASVERRPLPRPTLNFVYGGIRVDEHAYDRRGQRSRTLANEGIMPITLDQHGLSRRTLLSVTSLALVGVAAPRLAMAALMPTPRQTAGPFYPKSLPLHPDNDLVRIAGHEKQADGIVTHIFGRVLDGDGRPVPQARIEIWQCDSHGRYHNVDDRSSRPLDPDFQGYGLTVSGDDGGYRFRTIRPVAYPGRTPHIHFAISPSGGGRLVTQMYVAGEPLNARDTVLNEIRDPAARARVIVALEPAAQVEPGALAGTFDIVLGL